MEPKLADLVGSTLDDVTVDWRNGIVRITFLAGPNFKESAAIRATDFRRVEIPRASSGTSRRVKSAVRTGDTVEIEVESGETLTITAATFALDATG